MKTQTQRLDGSCLICSMPITNPICPKCLEKEVEYWLSESGSFESIKGLSDFPIEKNTGCIKCGKNLGVCPYCYIKEVYELLLEKNSKTAEEFIELFNLRGAPLFI